MLELASKSLRVTLSSLGARLVSVFFDGADVVAGGGDDAQFLDGDWTAGAICGRVAGRIADAQFALDGETHRLVPNWEGRHQLHGGPDNFAIRKWQAEEREDAIAFSLHSADGDQGFPGALDATAIYSVQGSTLSLDLAARTTKPTIVNLTNHAYWNLGAPSAFDHDMQINAARFIPLDRELMPTGEIKDVAGTRWDFRDLRKVAEPYDNCWALDGARSEMKRALVLRDPSSGRCMEVWTTEGALQMYTALHWNDGMPGRSGPLRQYQAIAIEPQGFPDASTHENFPPIALRPGEVYRNHMEWRFSRS